MDANELKEHLDWIGDTSIIEDAKRCIDDLVAENERLRKALEQYADRDNWIYSAGNCVDVFMSTDNGWEIAEEALGENKE